MTAQLTGAERCLTPEEKAKRVEEARTWSLNTYADPRLLRAAGRVAFLLAELDLATKMHQAVITAVLYEVGGEVEGAPTSRINYLQRLRALVQAERERDAAQAQVEKLREALGGLLNSPQTQRGHYILGLSDLMRARAALSTPAPDYADLEPQASSPGMTLDANELAATYAARIRAEAYEEAAKVLDAEALEYCGTPTAATLRMFVQRLAKDIRALATTSEAPTTHQTGSKEGA